MKDGDPIRLKLTVHYDGARFHGWQVQPDVRTVQGELEAAAERLTSGHRTVTGSGRTDTGVHATGQVASLEVPGRWTPEEFRRSMNAVLPDDVWLREVLAASPDFHPRFDAVARTYEYRLGLAEVASSPFHRPWCWAVEGEVDQQLLDRTAARLPGSRSFASFAKSGQPERGDRCDVHAAGWSRWADLGLRFRITADRYLHHMVRYLVGTMVEVARGRRPEHDMEALLASGDDGLETSPPAPPQGLFLTRVEYPETHTRPTPERR